MKHTEGKLEVGGTFRGNRDTIPNCLLKDGELIAKFENPENAIRALATWNACEGLSTDMLVITKNSNVIDYLKDKLNSCSDLLEIAIDERDRLKASNGELLKACKVFVEAYSKSLQLEKTDTALRLAKQAIANAERGKDE
jgi:hypothetical protein